MRLAPGCVGYDGRWQFPAITEQHAFNQAARLLPISDHVVYFAFPWATLIDLTHTVGSKRAAALLQILDELSRELAAFKTIITVCQHIKALEYAKLIERAGVTDLFWSHATRLSVDLDVPFKLHPFPLYAVQQPEAEVPTHPRKHLFSFVGARANSGYLTASRNLILDRLSKHPGGFIQGRETWHYNRVVYDHQIRGLGKETSSFVDEAASEEFRSSLAQSVFSLCPSGSGPNSIRLWESIGFGAIPVILADTYCPPGNASLWNEAVVFCEETEQAIDALPAKLEAMALDFSLLARKRHALQQLWMIYGPQCFIYDVQKLYIKRHCEALGRLQNERVLPTEPLQAMAEAVLAVQPNARALRSFALSCATRLLLDPQAFRLALVAYPRISQAVELLIARHSDIVDVSRLSDLLSRRSPNVAEHCK